MVPLSIRNNQGMLLLNYIVQYSRQARHKILLVNTVLRLKLRFHQRNRKYTRNGMKDSQATTSFFLFYSVNINYPIRKKEKSIENKCDRRKMYFLCRSST